MSKQKIPAWNEERVAKLAAIVGTESPVSNDTVAKAAEELGTTPRSISAKLRNLDIEVAPVENVREKTFSEAEEAELRSFVESNSGSHTYAEIAAAVCGGAKTARQVQGKILSMELTDHVKATPKKEVERKYSEAEEEKIVSLMKKDGVFLEDIADALGKPLNSIRGKCLSLSRSDESLSIPAQKNHVSKDKSDPLTDLGEAVADMSVEDIAIKIEKSERGVKAMLTKRGIKCANYDGEARRAKADKKKADAS
jgi:predicted HTH domain antitoxin